MQEKNSLKLNYPVVVKTIIVETFYENATERSIETEDGSYVYYKQYTNNDCLHAGTETFLDNFLSRLATHYPTNETSGNTGNIVKKMLASITGLITQARRKKEQKIKDLVRQAIIQTFQQSSNSLL
jgi:hypothetical protein